MDSNFHSTSQATQASKPSRQLSASANPHLQIKLAHSLNEATGGSKERVALRLLIARGGVGKRGERRIISQEPLL